MLKKSLGIALIVLALMAVALLAPQLLHTVSPERVVGMDSVVDRIWWLATALRLCVYAALSWLVFPWLVRQRLAGIERACGQLTEAFRGPQVVHHWVLQKAHLQRVLGRSRWVFVTFLAGDLLLAQLPYSLSRVG
ncbi:MAG: hypothetical protein KDK04_09970 [Candidatus Competibacteraceae bacterium]|nr:hypothetical protein [Candidatus Competibacteraceae bacterium]MCB1805075.1 hypothetical protein [Candidatus Competibacteraceae bacterium]MCB1812029.1 hypothetical protein [Candidatus Competibacteraceae bacterium]